MTSIVDAEQYLFTSESVTEGHPDKMCDQISDAILDAILRDDPQARVACETARPPAWWWSSARSRPRPTSNSRRSSARRSRRSATRDARYGFDYRTCGTLVSVHEQSPDIKRGVDEALETRGKGGDRHDQGAGDQGMMFGFACRRDTGIDAAPDLPRASAGPPLAEVRKNGTLPYLRPDGKTQVTVEYERGVPKAVRDGRRRRPA